MIEQRAKCKQEIDDPTFDVVSSSLDCIKFGDHYKCYLFDNGDPSKCKIVGKDGVQEITISGDMIKPLTGKGVENVIMQIGGKSDIKIQGEMNCTIFPGKDKTGKYKTNFVTCYKIPDVPS